jgi:hypothetical protein
MFPGAGSRAVSRTTAAGIGKSAASSIHAGQRRRTGIEPADDAARRPPVLKTGGATRHPDASGADVTCARAPAAIKHRRANLRSPWRRPLA